MLFRSGCERLAQAGLAQYEISNFARPEAVSSHNQRYWRREPYLGVGLDAHSMLRTTDGRPVRFGNPDELTVYLDGDFAVEAERVDHDAELEEAWFLGLRLRDGISLERMRAEFGAPAIAAYDGVLSELAAEGLLMSSGDCVALTMRGRMLSNEAFARFLGVTAPVSR